MQYSEHIKYQVNYNISLFRASSQLGKHWLLLNII